MNSSMVDHWWRLCHLVPLMLIVSCGDPNTVETIESAGAADPMEPVQVEQVEPYDSEILEEWVRVTDEPDLLGIGASKLDDGTWQVFVSAAEFIRTEPLQSELFGAVTESLVQTSGVDAAYQEDREVWLVEGNVTGESLIQSCATALNKLQPRLREAFDALLSAT